MRVSLFCLLRKPQAHAAGDIKVRFGAHMAGFRAAGSVGVGAYLNLQYMEACTKVRLEQKVQNIFALCSGVFPQQLCHSIAGYAADSLKFSSRVIQIDRYYRCHRIPPFRSLHPGIAVNINLDIHEIYGKYVLQVKL